MYTPLVTRRHEDMKDVLKGPNLDGPEIHYYMIRGGIDKANTTVLESGNVGGEYIKTYGHYHDGNVREMYEIVGGEGIVLLQQRKIDSNSVPIDDEIETFIAIKVKPGDCVHMPPEFGHIIVNIGKMWLVTIDNTHIRSDGDAQLPGHVDYESVTRMHGFAYYIVDDCGTPKLVKNVNYKIVPEPQWLTVLEWENRSTARFQRYKD